MPLIICAEEFLDCSTSESLISHPRHYRNLSEMCSDAEVSRFGASSYRFLKTVTRYSKKPDQKVCILSLFLGFQACSLSPVSKQNLTQLTVSTYLQKYRTLVFGFTLSVHGNYTILYTQRRFFWWSLVNFSSISLYCGEGRNLRHLHLWPGCLAIGPTNRYPIVRLKPC